MSDVVTGSDEVVLDVRELHVTFRPPTGPVEAVRGVDLCLERGRVLGVVGESGSGKTASFRSLLGLNPASADVCGRIEFRPAMGERVSGSPTELVDVLRRESAMIYQNPGAALNPVFTIGQQLALAAETKDPAVLADLLDQVGLPDPERALQAYPHEYSGGMRQRAVIAMALAKTPTLLIADEPTTALDVTTQDRVLALLDELRERYGLTIAFISHDLAVVRRVADDIAVMRDGLVVEAGDAAAVLNDPQHEYTQALIAATPDGNSAGRRQHTGPLLEITDLAVDYRSRERRTASTRVIEGLDLTIDTGETVALVGESGSGKSTLAHAIVGLASAAEGSIRYDSTELVGLRGKARRPLQREIQIVFQNPLLSLNPRHRVGPQLEEPMQVHLSLRGSERRDRISDIIDELELDPELLDRFPHELSGGQAQRMVLARALLLEPRLIVFDEPTSALDVSVQDAVLDVLARLKAERQLTYLFITHDLAVAHQIADRIVVMRRGEIVERASAVDLFTDPQHDYTRELLAAAQGERLSPC